MALVDGDNGMGHHVMRFATEKAIEKARTAGVWAGGEVEHHAGPHRFMPACRSEHNMAGSTLR